MSNKERWQKLAGITSVDSATIKESDLKKHETPLTEGLTEGFNNLGLASPGVMGNPFGDRSSQVVKEQETDDSADTSSDDNSGDVESDEMQESSYHFALDDNIKNNVNKHVGGLLKDLDVSEEDRYEMFSDLSNMLVRYLKSVM